MKGHKKYLAAAIVVLAAVAIALKMGYISGGPKTPKSLAYTP